MSVGRVAGTGPVTRPKQSDAQKRTQDAHLQGLSRIPEQRAAEEQKRFAATVQQSMYTGKGSVFDTMI